MFNHEFGEILLTLNDIRSRMDELNERVYKIEMFLRSLHTEKYDLHIDEFLKAIEKNSNEKTDK